MSTIEDIGKFLGKNFAIGAIILVGAIYTVREILKLYGSLKELSKEKRNIELEKSRLEILKLNYEILALKKLHKLRTIKPDENIPPTPDLIKKELIKQSVTTQGKLTRMYGDYWEKGRWSRWYVYFITCALQGLGWSAIDRTVLEINAFNLDSMKIIDIVSFIANLLMLAASVYIGHIRLDSLLRQKKR